MYNRYATHMEKYTPPLTWLCGSRLLPRSSAGHFPQATLPEIWKENKSDDLLYWLWAGLHNSSAWLVNLVEEFGMSSADEEKLNKLEDDWRDMRRTSEHEWRKENRERLTAFLVEYRKDHPTFLVRESPISDTQIQRARERSIAEFTNPNKRGYILCPFHDDKNPSMSIKKGYGHCFVCGENMDAIRYIMTIRGLNFIEAVKVLQ